jgi:Rrf2 family transcriptional regulator, cysteine metabolism repressor
MWISTRAQYGLRALVEVALGGERPTSLKTVAERQQLSQPYLEQIFAVLRNAGIVESVRGAHGGYRMARPLSEVDALEVVELLEGSVAPVSCIEDRDTCERTGHCSTELLWREVDEAVRTVLRRTSLSDLVRRRSFLQLEPLPSRFLDQA